MSVKSTFKKEDGFTATMENGLEVSQKIKNGFRI